MFKHNFTQRYADLCLKCTVNLYEYDPTLEYFICLPYVSYKKWFVTVNYFIPCMLFVSLMIISWKMTDAHTSYAWLYFSFDKKQPCFY